MASLNEIKKRIKVIESTSKITNAMKLVATSKLKKQKDSFAKTNDFYKSFYKIFSIAYHDSQLKLILNKNTSNNTLWIVFTSSMGLCGGYNLNIVKELKNNIKENDVIILFGRKGSSIIKNKQINNEIILQVDIDDKNLNFDICDLLCQKVVEDYYADKYQNIKIIYMKFINSITFEPTIFSLLPLDDKLKDKLEKPVGGGYFKVEPSPESLLKKMLPKYLATCVYGALVEGKISENASRRNAMDGATKNANDLMVNYKLEFNRIRQSDITQEITEIISGSRSGGE